MNDTNDDHPPWEGAETEYKVLRDEILTRIRLRQQILAACLTLGGILLGIGVKWSPIVALLYPPLAAFLAFAWAQNDYRIRDISGYIRHSLEPKIPAVNWESHIRSCPRTLSSWRIVVIAHGGLFLFTQVFAIVVGTIWLVVGDPMPVLRDRIVGGILVVVDVVAFLIVIWILQNAKR